MFRVCRDRCLRRFDHSDKFFESRHLDDQQSCYRDDQQLFDQVELVVELDVALVLGADQDVDLVLDVGSGLAEVLVTDADSGAESASDLDEDLGAELGSAVESEPDLVAVPVAVADSDVELVAVAGSDAVLVLVVGSDVEPVVATDLVLATVAAPDLVGSLQSRLLTTFQQLIVLVSN